MRKLLLAAFLALWSWGAAAQIVNTLPPGATVPVSQTNGGTGCSGASCAGKIGLINTQVFAATGTYTPTAGTSAIEVEVLAQGGGSGGCAATGVTTNCASVAGGSGSYAKVYYAATPGGQTVTIATTGAGGTSAPTNGTAGGTASFGALISCPGGLAGAQGAAYTATNGTVVGSFGSQAAACTISGGTPTVEASIPGATPAPSVGLPILNDLYGAAGASAPFGYGSGGAPSSGTAAAAATGFGAGGGAVAIAASQIAIAGANPSGGLVIVHEYR